MTEETRRAGRPALPEGQARTATLRTMIRPETEERFIAIADHLGISRSDALREAAEDWMKKHAKRMKKSA